MTAPGLNPRDAKARLATEVVAMLYGRETGDAARAEFEALFTRKEAPSEMPAVERVAGEDPPALLVRAGMAASKGEARRLIEGGGLKRQDGEVWVKVFALADLPAESIVLKVGKQGRYLRLLPVPSLQRP